MVGKGNRFPLTFQGFYVKQNKTKTISNPILYSFLGFGVFSCDFSSKFSILGLKTKKAVICLEGRTSILSKWFPNVYLDTNRAKQIKQNSNFWQYPRFAREIFTQQKQW